MRKKMIIIILIFLFAFPVTALNTTDINTLIENTAKFNNTEVTVLGELIGEALERGEYAWINISDGTNAIGVWVKQSDINQIQYYGEYRHKGDIAEITGKFFSSCPAHGGDVDIHCSEIKTIEKGYEIKEEVSYIKLITAAISVSFTLLFLILYYKIMKRKPFANKPVSIYPPNNSGNL